MANQSRNTSCNTVPQASLKVTQIRQNSCKSLEGLGKLDYELGTDETGALHWRITRNSGGGFFSPEWIAFSVIRAALEKPHLGSPLTSLVLRGLFKGKSVNTPSFLLASLLAEGVVQLLEGKRRQYQLGDIDTFLTALKVSTHSTSKQSSTRRKTRSGDGMAEDQPKKPMER
jgi:hypothetical protein